MCFDHRKPCRRLSQLWRVRFDHRKSCRRLAEDRIVRFCLRKANRTLIDVRIVRFDRRKACEKFQKFGTCVLTYAKRVGGLQSLEKAF